MSDIQGIKADMQALGQAAKAAAAELAVATPRAKQWAIEAAAVAVQTNEAAILAANAQDMD